MHLFRCTRAFLPAALFVLLSHVAWTQASDTVVMRYRFLPGQQLTYRVLAYDSIVVRDTVVRTLARERAELVTIRCDSVLPESYVMTMTTTDYNAVERGNGTKGVERSRHPWVGRSIRFRMTHGGRRLTLLTTGHETPGAAPGGPVGPSLLPNIGGDTAIVGNASSFANNQWLVENVFPPVMWEGTSFRSVVRRFDTLGRQVLELELSDVGNSTYQQSGKNDPAVRATANGGGACFISVKEGYPVAGQYNRISTLMMTFPGGGTAQGRHSVGMLYELLPEGAGRTARAERLQAMAGIPSDEGADAAPKAGSPRTKGTPKKKRGKR